MIVVHQTAEVQHIGVVTLAVQTIQHRYKPAAQGWENHIRIAAYLHKVTPQAGQVFDQDQVMLLCGEATEKADSTIALPA